MRFRRPSTPSPLAGKVEMEGRSRRREKTDRRGSRKLHDSAYIALRSSDTAPLAGAAITPCEKSWGVDGALAVTICPWGSITTASVNVPPVSMPQMNAIVHSPTL
jgi:hypothetical protein